MAIVPYRPYAEVTPSGPDTPYQSSSAATPDAFGASIGQALNKFGDELGANALKMQERANQAHSTELFVAASKDLGDLDAQQGQLQGKARYDAYGDYQKSATDIWKKYSDAAGNPDTKRMFDQEFRRRVSYGVVDEAKHAATAFKQYTNQQNAAAITLLQQDAAGRAQDDQRFQTNVDNVNSIVKSMGEANNLSPENTEVMRRKEVGKLWANRLKTMSISDPFRAKELFDKNGEQIDDGALRDHIKDLIDQNVIRAGSKIGADEIWKSVRPQSSVDGDTYTKATFRIESGGNPNAVTGSNRGLGQFGPQEEQRFGLNDSNRNLPEAQARALGMETEQNVPKLQAALGRDPTNAELYITHQQGAAGGPALLANPDKPAWEAVRKFYGSDAIAKKAIYGNIPSDSSLRDVPVEQITAGQFTDMWKAKYNRFETQAGGGDNQSPIQVAQNIDPATKNDYLSPDALSRALGKVDEYATKTFPDDPGKQAVMRDQLTSELNRKYSTDKKVLTEQRNARSAIVMSELIPEDGKESPTHLEQLSMQAQMAYGDMDWLQKKKVDSQLQANARRDVPVTADVLKNYAQIKGLRITDPTAFQNLDPAESGLPRAMQKEIINLQLSDAKKLQDTTKINSALRNVNGMLYSAGLHQDKNDTATNDKYNAFVGAFEQRLSEFENEKKKFPTEEEQRKIASGVLGIDEGSGWFGSNIGASRNFEIPSDFKSRVTPDFVKNFGRPPTSRELFRLYQKDQGK